jgi:hypothetical protein
LEKSREKREDCLLELKRNQGALLEETKSYFINRENLGYYEEADKGLGRIELRQCWSTEYGGI